MKNKVYILLIFFSISLSVGSVFGQVIDTCALRGWSAISPDNPTIAKQMYDTLRLYIETCAAKDDQSYLAFNGLSGAVQSLSDDTSRFTTYRNWLIKVLYLNTTVPQYFCSCMGAIEGTYQFGKYFPTLAVMAIMDYLRKNHTECFREPIGDKEYTKDSLYVSQKGLDATNLPPLDSLGLGFLLGHSGVSTPVQHLSSFTSSPNPFIEETTLQFTLNRMTYTTVSIYDELGRLVWGDGRGASLEAGEHSIRLDAKNFPSGTLYARISTGFGEVKTVKLIHE